MLPYSESDKLEYEIKKLVEEVRVLKHPLTQPSSWLAIVGLIISVLLNLSQCSSSRNEGVLADIKLQQAKLDFREIILRNDSIKRVSDSLKVVEDVLAGNMQALNENYQVRQKQADSIQAKIDEAIARLNQLPVTGDSTSSNNAVAIGEIKRSLKTISTINQNTVTDFSLKTINAINQNVVPGFFIRNSAKNLPLAKQKEREGFQQLIAGNYEAAITAFIAAENAFNGYHMVYDLAKLIKNNKEALISEPGKRDELLRLVLSKYIYGAPQDIIGQLQEAVK